MRAGPLVARPGPRRSASSPRWWPRSCRPPWSSWWRMALALALGGRGRDRTPAGSGRMIVGALGGVGAWRCCCTSRGASTSSLPGHHAVVPHRAAPGPDQPSDLGALLRFEVGPLGSAPIGWCFLVAAALPLLIARGERHTWAVRGWTLAVGLLRGRLGGPARHPRRSRCRPSTCCSSPRRRAWPWPTAMGVARLRGRPARATGSAGARSPPGVAAAAVVVGHHPGARGLVRRPLVDAGRRPRPRRSRFIDDENDDDAVPGAVARRPRRAAARRLGARGRPRLRHHRRRLAHAREPLGRIRRRRHRAARRRARPRPHRARPPASAASSPRWACATSSCPSGWRPTPFATAELPVPAGGRRHAGGAARPRAGRRARRAHRVPQPGLPPDAGRGARRRSTCPSTAASPSALRLDLSGVARRAPRRPTAASAGPARSRTTPPCCCRRRSSDSWELEVDGSAVDAIEPFGWSTGFEVADGGDATLRFHTSPLRYVLLAIEALAWLWVLRIVAAPASRTGRRDRRRRRRHEVVAAHRARPARRRRRRRPRPRRGRRVRRRPRRHRPTGAWPASPCRPPRPGRR